MNDPVTSGAAPQTAHAVLPHFEVEIEPPDLSEWLPGNTGVHGVTTRESGAAGPHVALMALMHGNEFAGAIVLDRLLRAGLVPRNGRLSFAFGNVAAFERFDPRNPIASRFIDEDLNRIWDPDLLDGTRRSIELDRARELRPWIETVDVLLDLHSMLWPSDPLILCGTAERNHQLATGIGMPTTVIADPGHANGPRLIDYPRFLASGSTGRANLVEAGQHWTLATVDMALHSVAGLLRHLDIVEESSALPPPPSQRDPLFGRVTDVVTATSTRFNFVHPFSGGEVIAERNTLIALDGDIEIRTPYDNCLLVLPSLRPGKSHTAVRLARLG